MSARQIIRGGVNATQALHSPGPWSCHETDTRTAIKSGKRTVAYVQIGPNQDYDAALITAAPLLLELARQYASECFECAGVGVTPENAQCAACEHIRDVIAEAEFQP